MTGKGDLQERAHMAYLAACEVAAAQQRQKWEGRVRRANAELFRVLDLPPVKWEMAYYPECNKGLALVAVIDGVRLGVEFEYAEGVEDATCFLRVRVISDEGETYWPHVYSLADLGQYLAEDEEAREKWGPDTVARILGEVEA